MNIQNNMGDSQTHKLSERNHTQKLHNIMIAFTQSSRNGKIIGTGNRPND